jgi:hypothetical protein
VTNRIDLIVVSLHSMNLNIRQLLRGDRPMACAIGRNWRKLSTVFFWALLFLSLGCGLWVLYHVPRWQVDQLPEIVIQRGPAADARRLELENEAR